MRPIIQELFPRFDISRFVFVNEGENEEERVTRSTRSIRSNSVGSLRRGQRWPSVDDRAFEIHRRVKTARSLRWCRLLRGNCIFAWHIFPPIYKEFKVQSDEEIIGYRITRLIRTRIWFPRAFSLSLLWIYESDFLCIRYCMLMNDFHTISVFILGIKLYRCQCELS